MPTHFLGRWGLPHFACDHSRDLRQTWTCVREGKSMQHHQYPCRVRQIKNSILLPMTLLSCWSQHGLHLWLWALSPPKWDSSGSTTSIFRGKYVNLSVFWLLIRIRVIGGSSRSRERQTLFLPASLGKFQGLPWPAETFAVPSLCEVSSCMKHLSQEDMQEASWPDVWTPSTGCSHRRGGVALVWGPLGFLSPSSYMKADPSHPRKETHFSHLYLQSRPVSHYPKLTTKAAGWNLKWLAVWLSSLCIMKDPFDVHSSEINI